MSKSIELTTNNFTTEVLESPVPVLVDFFSYRCGPCVRMMPVVDELAQELDGKAKVAKVDVAEVPALAEPFQLAAIPTFIVFRNGKEAVRLRGLQTKQALKEALGVDQ